MVCPPVHIFFHSPSTMISTPLNIESERDDGKRFKTIILKERHAETSQHDTKKIADFQFDKPLRLGYHLRGSTSSLP